MPSRRILGEDTSKNKNKSIERIFLNWDLLPVKTLRLVSSSRPRILVNLLNCVSFSFPNMSLSNYSCSYVCVGWQVATSFKMGGWIDNCPQNYIQMGKRYVNIMFCITDYHRNSSQNNNEIFLHTRQIGTQHKKHKQSELAWMCGKGSLIYCCWEVGWSTCLRNNKDISPYTQH